MVSFAYVICINTLPVIEGSAPSKETNCYRFTVGWLHAIPPVKLDNPHLINHPLSLGSTVKDEAEHPKDDHRRAHQEDEPVHVTPPMASLTFSLSPS